MTDLYHGALLQPLGTNPSSTKIEVILRCARRDPLVSQSCWTWRQLRQCQDTFAHHESHLGTGGDAEIQRSAEQSSPRTPAGPREYQIGVDP
jgi:hypothetical protein